MTDLGRRSVGILRRGWFSHDSGRGVSTGSAGKTPRASGPVIARVDVVSLHQIVEILAVLAGQARRRRNVPTGGAQALDQVVPDELLLRLAEGGEPDPGWLPGEH